MFEVVHFLPDSTKHWYLQCRADVHPCAHNFAIFAYESLQFLRQGVARENATVNAADASVRRKLAIPEVTANSLRAAKGCRRNCTVLVQI